MVGKRLPPSRPQQSLSYAARLFPDNQNSQPLLEDYTAIKLSDLSHAAEHEHVTSLVDLLFRRVGAGWTRTMADGAAENAARAVAGILGWDEPRVARELAAYREHLRRQHAWPAGN